MSNVNEDMIDISPRLTSFNQVIVLLPKPATFVIIVLLTSSKGFEI